MNKAVDHLTSQGDEINPEDMARLSPLIHEHINFLGRYSFFVDDSVIGGELRPLHFPNRDRHNP